VRDEGRSLDLGLGLEYHDPQDKELALAELGRIVGPSRARLILGVWLNSSRNCSENPGRASVEE
jgi:hypothetical protein